MDRRASTVEEYFTKLHAEPAITTGELEAMLDAPARRSRLKPWVRWGAAGSLGVALTVAAFVTFGGVEKDLPAKPASPRMAASAPVNAASAVKAAPTVMAAPLPAATAPAQSAPSAKSLPAGTHAPSAIASPAKSARAATASPAKPAPALIARATPPRAIRKSAPATLSSSQTSDFRIQNSSIAVSTNGVRMVELNDDELAQLGVQVRSDGMVVIYSKASAGGARSHDSGSFAYNACTLGGARAHTVAVGRDDLPQGVKPGTFPELITGTSGAQQLVDPHPSRADHADSSRRSLGRGEAVDLAHSNPVSNLVPVLIRVRGRANVVVERNAETRDLVLWYHPSEEILSRLPSCLCDVLRNEFATATAAESETCERPLEGLSPRMRFMYDSLTAGIARTIMPCTGARVIGKPYLDIWRSSSGMLLASAVTSNPAHRGFKLRYWLGQPRSVVITLHDLTGKPARVLADSEPKTPGEWTADLNLKGVGPGIYLVAITTEKGEQAVQRVVVD